MTTTSEPDQPEPREPLTVHQAIAAVMVDLEAVGKTRRGPQEQGGYEYRGIEDVTAALQKLCGKHGVVIWPVTTQGPTDPAVGMRDGWFDHTVTVTWGVAGPDGSLLEPAPVTVGIGRDNSDKGVNKAMTQAYKYLLLQTFMVADPKDDTDKHGAYDQGRRSEAEQQGPRLLAKDVAEAFAAEIKALPPEARDHLVKSWMAEDPMTGDPYLPVADGKPALRFVLAEHEQAVRTLIAVALRHAKAAGSAPESPSPGPDEDAAPVTAADPETGTQPEADPGDEPDDAGGY